MDNKPKKIALLKDGGYYILVLLLNNKLSYIRTKKDLRYNVNVYRDKLTVTTYKINANEVLDILYGEKEDRNVSEIHGQSGTIVTMIGDNVFCIHEDKALNRRHKDGCIEAYLNVNDIRNPEYEYVRLTNELHNCISYRKDNMYIILNNLPYDIIQRY